MIFINLLQVRLNVCCNLVKLDFSSFKLMLEILASFSADPTLSVRLGSVDAGLVKVFVATGV